MKLKYNTIKTPLTYEEKIDKACLYLGEFYTEKDVEEFAKKDIYDEHIHLKCKTCGYEEIPEYDIISEICYGMDYPMIDCPACSHIKHGIMIPIDIYNQLYKK